MFTKLIIQILLCDWKSHTANNQEVIFAPKFYQTKVIYSIGYEGGRFKWDSQKILYIRLLMIKNVLVFNDGMGDIYLKIND